MILILWLPIFKKTVHFQISTFAIFIMSFNEHVLLISCVGQYSNRDCGTFADMTNVQGLERGLDETGLGPEAHLRIDKPPDRTELKYPWQERTTSKSTNRRKWASEAMMLELAPEC